MEDLVFNKKSNSIQKVNLSLLKEKHLLSKNNNINSIDKYFICPKCNINIPSLPFFINPIEAGSIEILINCKCGNKDRMPLEDYFNFKIPVLNIDICEECNSNKPNLNCSYCIDCAKWICEDCIKYFDETEKNHNYSDYPVIFSQACNIHINHENLFYCITCNNDFCKKCVNNHPKTHKIINLNEYYNKVKELHSIENIENKISIFINKNEELKNNCLENFDKIEYDLENVQNEEDFLKDIFIDREKLLELYEKNKSLNEQLNKFIHTLYNLFILAQNHPNYNIIHNLEISSFVNETFPEIDWKNKTNANNYYISLYKKIYKHFRENHLLSIKSVILIKEEEIYLDKYNIKHLLKINDESLLVTMDSNFQIFNIKKKEFTPEINAHNKEITKIILINNKNIVSGAKDGEIKIWSIDNSISFKNSLSGHNEEIIELKELSDRNLLSADKNRKIILWNMNKYKQMQMFLLNYNILAITEISLLDYLIVTDKNVMTLQNNKKGIKQSFNENKILSALFFNSNLILFTDDNMMRIYEYNPFKEIKAFSINNNITTIKKFNDKYIYGISSDYNLYFLKTSNFEQISCITIKTYHFYEFLYMNEYTAYCGSNNGLIEWNLNIHDLIDDYVDNIVII